MRRTDTASSQDVTYEDGKSNLSFSNSLGRPSDFMTQTQLPGRTMPDPPYHWHIYQTEYFHVVSGSIRVTVDGVEKIASPDDNMVITPGVHHMFSNASSTEALVVQISLAPFSRARDKSFFRNLFGYFDDCRKQGKAPSFPQLLLFLHFADVVLVLPGPKRTSHPLGRLMNLLVGVIVGKWLLGFHESYPEYYKERIE